MKEVPISTLITETGSANLTKSDSFITNIFRFDNSCLLQN